MQFICFVHQLLIVICLCLLIIFFMNIQNISVKVNKVKYVTILGMYYVHILLDGINY